MEYEGTRFLVSLVFLLIIVNEEQAVALGAGYA
jgi:hypothetical protein